MSELSADTQGFSEDTRALDAAHLRRLIEVGRSLVAELDLDELLRRLLEVARELTGARYAALGVVDPSRTSLARFITSGLDPATACAIGDSPHGHGVLGELIRRPEPLRLEQVSAHPRSYGFPPHHPPMDSFLGVPVLVHGRAWGNLYLTEKDTGSFTADDELTLLVLADWASIAIRNADRHRAERRRRNELERTVAALEATMSIARALGAETDLSRVLELVTKRGRALVEARVMIIALDDGEELVVRAVAGSVPADLLGRRLRLATALGPETAAMSANGGERLAGQATRLRRALGREMGAETGLVVPLRYREETVGVLAAFDRMDGGMSFSADDERLLEAFAASAATAVVTAQRVAARTLARRVEAAEQERARWARELHDESLQELAGLKILLASARRTGGSEALMPAVDEAIGRLSSSIEGLRGLIADLRPAALDELGVTAALEGLAERTRAGTQLEVALHVAVDEPRLAASHPDIDVASTIYRLVQEGLTNVVKHAQARRVSVSVVGNAQAVDVRIGDDGRGFDPRGRGHGFGIAGMRERVELAQGRLEVTSTPGSGTVVRAHIPLVEPGSRGGTLGLAG